MERDQIRKLIQDLDANLPAEVQRAAVQQLLRVGSDVLPMLWRGTSKRHWANLIRVIREMGYPANAAAIPALVEQLQDLNWPGSTEAMAELVSIGDASLSEVRRVMRAHWEDEGWMWNIRALLLRMKPELASLAVPELLQLLNYQHPDKPDWNADWAAMDVLAHIGSPAADAAIPLLAERAADASRTDDYRLDALAALRCLRPRRAEVALPYLQSCLEDRSAAIRMSAQATMDRWRSAD